MLVEESRETCLYLSAWMIVPQVYLREKILQSSKTQLNQKRMKKSYHPYQPPRPRHAYCSLIEKVRKLAEEGKARGARVEDEENCKMKVKMKTKEVIDEPDQESCGKFQESVCR